MLYIVLTQLLAKVQVLCKRMCDVFNMPVPKVVAELFSLASSMEVPALCLSVCLSVCLSRHVMFPTGGGQ